jgi:hypothetical protein
VRRQKADVLKIKETPRGKRKKQKMATSLPQFNVNDDEIDAIPVPTRPTTTQATAPAVAKPATATTVAAEDISFDDEGIDEVVKASDGLTVIKINKGEVARFAFVPGFKIKRARVHYVDGTGSLQCISTKENPNEVCCRKGGQAKDKFVGLVFRYTNIDPKTGKFLATATTPAVEVQAVRMSRANMRDILDSAEEGQSVYDLDIRMRHDDSRAFGYKFSKASSKNAWRSIEADALALATPFADGTKLASRLGKKLDSVQLNAVLAANHITPESTQKMEKMLADLEE